MDVGMYFVGPSDGRYSRFLGLEVAMVASWL